MPKKGARHFAKEGLHNIEPRSMLGCQHVLETVRSGSEVGLSLFGDMRRMVIQNNSKGAVSRIVLIEILEQSDEFSAAMSPLNAGCDVTLVQIQRREDRTRSKAFVFVIAADVGMLSGNWGQIGRRVGDSLKAGLFIDGNRDDRRPPFPTTLRFVLQRNLLINQQYIPHPDFEGGIAFFQVVTDSFGMQRLFGQYPLHCGLGSPAQRRMSRLYRLAPNMPCQQTPRPQFG